LLLSCEECSVNYFSAASGGDCPDCGAELGPGSPLLTSLLDVNGDGDHSNGNGTRRSEYDHLWDLALGEQPLSTGKA
jgi:hypothetical protein